MALQTVIVSMIYMLTLKKKKICLLKSEPCWEELFSSEEINDFLKLKYWLRSQHLLFIVWTETLALLGLGTSSQ